MKEFRMSDEQTTSELVQRLVQAQEAEQKAYLRFSSPANKRVVDYLGDAISAIEALQARVDALEGERDELLYAFDRIISTVPAIDPTDGTFFTCHFDEDGNEVGVSYYQEGQVVSAILDIVYETRKEKP
jgi:hypothetical protein